LLKRQVSIVRTFTENLMTYALGRRLEARDMPAVRDVVRQAEAAEHRFSSYVSAIVKSAAFRMSAAPAALTEGR
jgi:hypothetical protein